jgi:hypothetical protein
MSPHIIAVGCHRNVILTGDGKEETGRDGRTETGRDGSRTATRPWVQSIQRVPGAKPRDVPLGFFVVAGCHTEIWQIRKRKMATVSEQ